MPEITIPEKIETYSIPTFLAPKMPKELSNEPKEEVKEVKEVKVEPAEAVKDAPKPVAEAATTETEKAEEVKEEPKAEPEKETTGKDPEKASTRRFERRIDRAIRARAEAQARADLLEKELAELKAKAVQPKALEPAGKPRQENFTDVDEYANAVAEWKTAETLKEKEESARKEAFSAAQREMLTQWEGQVDKATDKYDDFHEIVGELKAGVTPWGDAIMQSENGADIAYHLAKHEKEAERIFKLPPAKQFIEIGKLSAKLSLAPEAPKKPSKAPAPIAPVTGAAETGEVNVSDPMPFEKYMKVGAKMFRGR